MTVETSPHRAIRQRDLVPPAELAFYHALVVGVGAVGRQVATQLAALGVPSMTLVDDDTVGVENLAVQGYYHSDIGLSKVETTQAVCMQLNPDVEIKTVSERFKRSSLNTLECLNNPTAKKLVVFSCVDSMSARKIVWETTKSRLHLFVDGRMAGEVIRVLASNGQGDTYYPATLFDDSQAFPAPCTGRSTLYAASLAASLMLHRFSMQLRNFKPLPDTMVNLLANEIIEVASK